MPILPFLAKAGTVLMENAPVIGQSIGGLFQAKKNRQFQKEMAQFQFDKNMEAWNIQNQYNSPAEQMKRLEEAGLNPNLVYGTGTQASTGQAKEIPSYSNPATGKDYWMPEFVSMMSSMAQAVKAQAQTVNTEIDTERKKIDYRIVAETFDDAKQLINRTMRKANAEMAIKSFQAALLYTLIGGKDDYQVGEYWNVPIDEIISSPAFRMELNKADVTEQEIRLKKADAELNEKLREWGANSSTLNVLSTLLRTLLQKAR